ncbi:MAG: flagellar biosynthesis protein FliQ [Alcaligenaceae bacterium]|nr:flagellar biosynthesis protein FliQ [Alcaligenaceae bacterium]
MTPETVMSMTHIALKMALTMAGPFLLTALIIGLAVSVFQAATQINEMTLTFIPKIAGIAVVVILIGPWLINTMVDYMQQLFIQIPTLVM